jgi:lipopolysaccharide transport system ATP-binding protein
MGKVVKIKGLSKKYKIDHERAIVQHKDLRDSIYGLFQKSKKKEDFWALKDVNFEMEKGEILGLIGSNGAGKSTLLKLLSKITYPTSGTIEIIGRLGALLEVGTGFHPDLTGRENIFLSGAILGMKKKEINKHFDEIVEFSEVEQFLDIPVKRFSSGMFLKLAFSVMTFLDADILLVDEVLAVGDGDFQKKCIDKIRQIVKSGKTIIFVSHNLDSIASLCPKSILLDHGVMIKYGDSLSLIDYYQKKTYTDRN